MKKYKVEIEEILRRVVEVEAESEIEAVKNVQKQYCEEEIILDSSDHVDTTIRPLNFVEISDN